MLNIFWSQENMPEAGCGDVIVILAAKVLIPLRALNKADQALTAPTIQFRVHFFVCKLYDRCSCI